jgi:hypothetical protein
MGHQNFTALQKMARTGMVRGMPSLGQADQLCEACLAGNQRRAPFPQAAKYRAEQTLELVHADLCGPISPPTPGGNKFFLLMVDDHSSFMWLRLLASKSEAAAGIKLFKMAAEVESGHSLRTFRTDRGGEFTSGALGNYFAEHGVQRHLTAPYSPQQNGVVERRNQTVVGMARSMLKARNVPNRFWGEAVSTAIYVLNRSYTRAVDGKTPIEAWYGRRPDVEHLRTFGCIAHAKVTRPGLQKLADRSIKAVFFGYEQGSKAYKLYDPVANRMIVSRDVVFEEAASWPWDDEHGDDQADPLVVEYLVHGGAPARRVAEAPARQDALEIPAAASTEESHAGSVHTAPWTGENSTPKGTPTANPAATAVRSTPSVDVGEEYNADDDPALPHRFHRVAELLE